MKKLKFFIPLFILGALSYQAQAQAEISLGLKGGLNFSKLDVSSSVGENYESRTGYHAGAFGLVKLAMIGIQPEIIFSRQGTNYQLNSQDIEENFDYINIPIIFKLYLGAGFNLQAGPQFGFLSKAEAQSVISGVKTTSDVKNLYKDNDTSLALGIGWDLPLGLTIDARYNLGLSDISEGSSEKKNQVIQISAGFKIIKLGK